MTTIYRVVWKPDEILPDRGGYVEFLELSCAEVFRDENYPDCQIEIIERELTLSEVEVLERPEQ